MDLIEKLATTAAFLADTFGTCPRLALVLGSGLGAFADNLADAQALPYADIPNFLTGSVQGHQGRLVVGKVNGERVVCMQGRLHLYEGIPIADVVFPVRALARWGVKAVVLTNAAGGISAKLAVGNLMLITDHINMLGQNPLTGPNVDGLGPRFPALDDAYDTALGAVVQEVARNQSLPLRAGVYAAMAGPSYETPAEIRMLQVLGADAVGMSTVPAVIALRHMGVRVVGISCITNVAAGLSEVSPDHADVIETGARVAEGFRNLLAGAVPELIEQLGHSERKETSS